MFQNQGWALPSDLRSPDAVVEELTLWRAIKLFLTYPGISDSPNRERYQQAFVHIVTQWGKDFPVKRIWIPQIKEFQQLRLREGAAASTINKEKSALSKMFEVLLELRHVEVNPARRVTNLSEKSGEREVYISAEDFAAILRFLPDWLVPVAQIAYYTGMRQGEILGLTRKHLKLAQRLIVLGPQDVKESHWKRVPVHRDLIPILQDAMRVQSLNCENVFLIKGRKIVRHSIRKPWNKACKKIGLSPCPTFHDLRHTWRANASRSGMDSDIAETIMGHSERVKSVKSRYLRISDEQLISAIDGITFDHGETEILLSNDKKENPDKGTLPLSGNLRTRCVQAVR